jgi:hypothetical protein
MKIQKFNEKLGSELTFPDFLKDTLLEEYLECSLKLVYIKDEVKAKVLEWVDYNEEYLNHKYDFYTKIDSFEIYSDYSLSLIISINGTYHIDIDNKDYKDLVFFIKDSEAYKVSKNYNL